MAHPVRDCLNRFMKPAWHMTLEQRGIKVQRQLVLPVHYNGKTIEAGLRVDLLVDECLVLELKAIESLQPIHTAELLTCLKRGSYPLGLLLNFNVTRMKGGIKRLANGMHE